MFAHCLLPALLLLTAHHCAGIEWPPVKTVTIQPPWIDPALLNREAHYQIPSGQCSAHLNVDQQEQLQCGLYESRVGVRVTVNDFQIVKIDIADDLSMVDILRTLQPFCYGVGIVKVEVACLLYGDKHHKHHGHHGHLGLVPLPAN